MPLCAYCDSPFPHNQAIQQHIGKSVKCQKKRLAHRQELLARTHANTRDRLRTESNPHISDGNDQQMDVDFPEPPTISTGVDTDTGCSNSGSQISNNATAGVRIPPEQFPIHDIDARRPAVTVEEVQDVDAPGLGNLWVEPFPCEKKPGASKGMGRTSFQKIRDDQILRGHEILGPFKDDGEWELAKWLIKNVGHNQTEAFLKLPI
ncbi:hypothetical protein BJ138DRAFT_1120524, partial [Hygrophoropsis aurantiaca]